MKINLFTLYSQVQPSGKILSKHNVHKINKSTKVIAYVHYFQNSQYFDKFIDIP